MQVTNIPQNQKSKENVLLNLITWMLKLYGLHPDQKGPLQVFLIIVPVISASVNIILMIMEILFRWNGIATLKRIDLFPASVMVDIYP